MEDGHHLLWMRLQISYSKMMCYLFQNPGYGNAPPRMIVRKRHDCSESNLMMLHSSFSLHHLSFYVLIPIILVSGTFRFLARVSMTKYYGLGERKQQSFLLSQFWRLDLQDQGDNNRDGFEGVLSSLTLDGCLKALSSHGLSSKPTCKPWSHLLLPHP